jgi:hypothetical protein
MMSVSKVPGSLPLSTTFLRSSGPMLLRSSGLTVLAMRPRFTIGKLPTTSPQKAPVHPQELSSVLVDVLFFYEKTKDGVINVGFLLSTFFSSSSSLLLLYFLFDTRKPPPQFIDSRHNSSKTKVNLLTKCSSTSGNSLILKATAVHVEFPLLSVSMDHDCMPVP